MAYVIVSSVSAIIGACIGVTVTCLLTASKRAEQSHSSSEGRDAPTDEQQDTGKQV